MDNPRTNALLIALLVLGGCASAPSPVSAPSPIRETVVLLPGTSDQAASVVVSVSDGKATPDRPAATPKAAPAGEGSTAAGRAVGVVTVTTPGGTVTLDEPYETAEVTEVGAVSTRKMDESESNQKFGSVLAAQPPRPISFTLYFVEGTDRLTPESVPTINQVKTVMATWPAPDVSVIGHTDRLGSEDANDKLSLQRAEMVKKALVDVGIDGGKIDVVARGEREPLVPTGDEVPEPRNRRVEINIR